HCDRRTGILRFVFFFFQAEDGIRDFHVTGVQTCALPISVGYATNSLPCSDCARIAYWPRLTSRAMAPGVGTTWPVVVTRVNSPCVPLTCTMNSSAAVSSAVGRCRCRNTHLCTGYAAGTER